MKRFVGTTKNGIDIYAINQDAHMAAHESVTDEMLTEALKLVDYKAPFWMESIDVGHVIGTDNCVSVSESDDVKMLYRKGRAGKSPIVFGREPAKTNLLTIGICHDDDGIDTIFTAFTGVKAPKEPWDPSLKSDEAKQEAEDFWKVHALVFDESIIDSERNWF